VSYKYSKSTGSRVCGPAVQTRGLPMSLISGLPHTHLVCQNRRAKGFQFSERNIPILFVSYCIISRDCVWRFGRVANTAFFVTREGVGHRARPRLEVSQTSRPKVCKSVTAVSGPTSLGWHGKMVFKILCTAHNLLHLQNRYAPELLVFFHDLSSSQRDRA
jgi:hypothetical protein